MLFNLTIGVFPTTSMMLSALLTLILPVPQFVIILSQGERTKGLDFFAPETSGRYFGTKLLSRTPGGGDDKSAGVAQPGQRREA